MANSYTTGTVSVTNGSAIVTGSGTAFSLNAVVGGFLQVDGDTRQYEIIAAPSATSITLDKPYAGTTGSGKTYRIFLTSAQAASNITINRQLGEIIARLVGSAPEIQDFLDAATLGDAQTALGISTFIKTLLDDADAAAARATLGVGSASNLTSGTVPDARLPGRIGPLGSTVTDWNNVNASGVWISARQTDGVLNTPGGASAPYNSYYWQGQATFYSSSFGYVEVISFNDDNQRWGRWRFAGAWGAWFECKTKQTALDARYPRKPQASAGAGQFVAITSTAGGGYTLPAGGSWVWWGYIINVSTSLISSSVWSGIASGGTNIMSPYAGYYWIGFAWRISE